nr:NB-ARC domain-containing protein [Actinoplanes toevensis]
MALTGTRGAGKTQLAARYAQWCLDHGFDLVAWINAESELVRELALLAVHLELPGAAEMKPEQAAAAACRWLEADGRARRLLVLDNVDDPDTLRKFLPASGSTKVLITTNRQEFTSMAGIAAVQVGMFTPAEGAAFLSRTTRLNPAGEGTRLGDLLGWLPLGLAQAAAFIARNKMSYREYSELLQGQELDETLRQQAGADHPGVLKVTRLSLAGLARADRSGDAARLLRVLSLLSPGGVSLDLLVRGMRHLAMLGGLWSAVKVLVEASLITVGGDAGPAAPGGEGRVVAVHRLIARVVRHEAAKPPGDDLASAADAVTRWLDALVTGFSPTDGVWRVDDLNELADHLDAVVDNTAESSPEVHIALALVRVGLEEAVGRRDSDLYLLAVTRNTAYPMVVTDEDQRIRYASPPLRELLGGEDLPPLTTLTDLVDPDDRMRVSQALPSFADGVVFCSLLRADGSRVPVEATYRDLREDRLVQGFVVTIRECPQGQESEEPLPRPDNLDVA